MEIEQEEDVKLFSTSTTNITTSTSTELTKCICTCTCNSSVQAHSHLISALQQQLTALESSLVQLNTIVTAQNNHYGGKLISHGKRLDSLELKLDTMNNSAEDQDENENEMSEDSWFGYPVMTLPVPVNVEILNNNDGNESASLLLEEEEAEEMMIINDLQSGHEFDTNTNTNTSTTTTIPPELQDKITNTNIVAKDPSFWDPSSRTFEDRLGSVQTFKIKTIIGDEDESVKYIYGCPDPTCSYEAPHHYTVRGHYDRMHIDKALQKCSHCQQIIKLDRRTGYTLFKHRMTNCSGFIGHQIQSFSSTGTGIETESYRNDLLNQEEEMENDEEGSFSCKFCSLNPSFGNKRELAEHYTIHHTNKNILMM